MFAAATESDFVVGGPNLAFLALSAAILVSVAISIFILGAKGRWAWFLVGVFIPALWLAAPFLRAKPGSPWDRRQQRRRASLA